MKGRWRLLIAAAVAAVTVAWLVWARGFFPQHALLAGIAVGALTWTAFGTMDRLRGSWGRTGPRSIELPRRDGAGAEVAETGAADAGDDDDDGDDPA